MLAQTETGKPYLNHFFKRGNFRNPNLIWNLFFLLNFIIKEKSIEIKKDTAVHAISKTIFNSYNW